MPAPFMPAELLWLKDERLREVATARQLELMDAVIAECGVRPAARKLGINAGNFSRAFDLVKAKAARNGYAPGHFADGVAPGYRMGKVTIQRSPKGVERVWERQHPEGKASEEAIREFVEHLAAQAGGILADPTPPPAATADELLAVYLFGDPHFGMKAFAAEAGEDFDLNEADRLTRAGIDRLAMATPPADTALLVAIGDNTHANDSSNKTPGHGNAVDVDGRHYPSILAAAKAWAYAARRLLTKHRRVVVWILPGNHDPDASYAIAVALSMHFESEPRIEIEVTPALYRYFRFGKVLIGSHHGHGAKQADLPLIMAVDRPQDWGAANWRYIYMGHIHHDSVKEVQGVRVESIRTLATKDAWHAGKGYRSLRDTRAIIHHQDFGEIERFTCSAAMLAPAA